MEVVQLIETIFTVVGGVVVILGVVAPLTKATWDDKILLFLKQFTSRVKINKDEGTLLIQVKTE